MTFKLHDIRKSKAWQGRSRIAGGVLMLIAFVVLGYYSNVLSLSACEQEMNGPGVSSQPAEFTYPWAVKTHYTRVSGKCGVSGTNYYVSLFGFATRIRS